MGNRSRRKTQFRSGGAPPAAPASDTDPRIVSFINSRGDVCFLNLGRMKAAAFGTSGGRSEFVVDFPDGESATVHGQAARDIVGHLLATTTAVHGAAAWFEQRWGTKLEEFGKVLEDGELGKRIDQVETGEVVEDACVICKCTECTPCTGNDGNPCHWTRPGVLCSTCAEALEVLELLELGKVGEELLTPAERRVLELLEEAGYDPGVAANMRRKFDLVEPARLRPAAASEVVEIVGSSADRSSCPHGAAVAEECKLFPRCHVCDRQKAKTFHDPATNCSHDDKEECDDCNDCGAMLRTNCAECFHYELPSCTWSNAGPLPCPGFKKQRTSLRFAKTEDPHVEEREATREELEHARDACNVYQGLKKHGLADRASADLRCHVGEEMDAAWCDVCPYFSKEGC